MKKLSVIVPVYNESHRIEKTLLSIDAFLSSRAYESEILAVDDGSKDNTAPVLKNLARRIKNLRIIENKENHGKGWVVRQGMLEASGDVRVFMDADNSTKIDEISKFLPFFEEGYDVVIGSRRTKGSVIAVHQPWIRDLEGGIFRLIVHTLVPLNLTDSQCGFKAFSSRAAQSIFPKQKIFRWAFDVEILALARKLNFKIKEVPITWINDIESHVKLSGKIKMLLEVMQTRWYLWTGKYK